MSLLYERRLRRSRFLSRNLIILAFRFLWVIVVIWCEVGVFFHSLSDCKWPDKVLRLTYPHAKPTRVLLISDAQVRDPAATSSLWSQYGSVTAYLRKSWSAVSRLHPDIVIFLGDTLASGRYVTSKEDYDTYYRKFQSIFPLDVSVPFYFIPGNSDVGLGDSSTFSKDARQLFTEHFGPLSQVLSISGYKFVLLDAPGLVDEDYRRHARLETYHQWTPLSGGTVDFLTSIPTMEAHPSEPIVLFTHIPLSRPSSRSCGPLREKGSIRAGAGQGYQNMLGKETSQFLLKMLQPSVIFSGDNRDYCDITHEILGSDPDTDSKTIVREVTVKSFSPSRHIRRPGFQLLSLIPPSSVFPSSPIFADAACHLPDTVHIFHSIYLPCFALTALLLLLLNTSPSHRHRRLSALSPMSLTEPSPSGPESAIWSTFTPRKSKEQTSPPTALPSVSRISNTKAIPSYRATSIPGTPQGSPLLSPIMLFPPEDEMTAEGETSSVIRPSHRDYYHIQNGGWIGRSDDESESTESESRRLAPVFLPPPTSQDRRNRGSYSFTLCGRRRRVVIALPSWGASLFRFTSATRSSLRRRGLFWRLVSDSLSIAFPAVIVWVVVNWMLF